MTVGETHVNRTSREHRWTLVDPPDAEVVARLSREINVPEPIARILVYRGIDDYDKAKAYFRPTLDHLHDPFLLDGMEVAVNAHPRRHSTRGRTIARVRRL